MLQALQQHRIYTEMLQDNMYYHEYVLHGFLGGSQLRCIPWITATTRKQNWLHNRFQDVSGSLDYWLTILNSQQLENSQLVQLFSYHAGGETQNC
jgi:hypothetical protein